VREMVQVGIDGMNIKEKEQYKKRTHANVQTTAQFHKLDRSPLRSADVLPTPRRGEDMGESEIRCTYPSLLSMSRTRTNPN
jgi:hypothetical protein